MSLLLRQIFLIQWVVIACFTPCLLLSQDIEVEEAEVEPEPVNPFSRPKSQAPVTEPISKNPLDNLEFTGLMMMGGKLQVSVYDKIKRQSFWLIESVPNEDGLMLVSYVEDDQGNIEKVTLNRETNIKEILLNSSSIAALPSPPVEGTPPAPAAAPTSSKPAVKAAQPSSTDEEVRDRMKRVADEIRRRRAMRSELLKERQSQQEGN